MIYHISTCVQGCNSYVNNTANQFNMLWAGTSSASQCRSHKKLGLLSFILSFLQRWQTLRHPEENSLTFVPVWNVCSRALWDHLSGLESFLLHCNLPGGSWCLCSVSLWLECLLHHSWQKKGECEPTVGWSREGGKSGEGALWINNASAEGSRSKMWSEISEIQQRCYPTVLDTESSWKCIKHN